MPFADPDEKLLYMQDWRARQMRKGYGKWLYARRKLRFDDAKRFREALEWIADAKLEDGSAAQMKAMALDALAKSQVAEEALGPFVPDSNP